MLFGQKKIGIIVQKIRFCSPAVKEEFAVEIASGVKLKLKVFL
jgi:hypothetical protein